MPSVKLPITGIMSTCADYLGFSSDVWFNLLQIRRLSQRLMASANSFDMQSESSRLAEVRPPRASPSTVLGRNRFKYLPAGTSPAYRAPDQISFLMIASKATAPLRGLGSTDFAIWLDEGLAGTWHCQVCLPTSGSPAYKLGESRTQQSKILRNCMAPPSEVV